MENNIDISKPIDGFCAVKLLKSNGFRDWFINDYIFFGKDGNTMIYIDWLNENISNEKNLIVENVYTLAGLLFYINERLLERASVVLANKYYKHSKLAVLDWILTNHKQIKIHQYESLNNIVLCKLSVPLVKFQALINLSLIDELKVAQMIYKLRNDESSTLFYRLINSLFFFPEKLKNDLGKIVLEEVKGRFSEAVEEELNNMLKHILLPVK